MRVKSMIVVIAILSLTCGAFAAWTFSKSMNPATGESCQFCDTDNVGAKGQLWVTDYGTPGTTQLLVYDLNTGNVNPTIIPNGLLNDGSTVGAYTQAGGVAYDPQEDLIYTITRDADTVTPLNQVYMFKYIPSTLTAVAGCDLTGLVFGSPPAPVDNPGDIDVLTSGGLTYVVFTNKVSEEWGIFDPRLPLAVWAEGPYAAPGWYLNRGISCTPDGMKVFRGDEQVDEVPVWNKQPGSSPLYVKSGTPLDNTAGGDQSACEVDDFGGGLHVLASITATSTLKIYDAMTSALLDTVVDATNLSLPRGAAYANDDGALYIAQFTSTVPVVQEFTQGTGVDNWFQY